MQNDYIRTDKRKSQGCREGEIRGLSSPCYNQERFWGAQPSTIEHAIGGINSEVSTSNLGCEQPLLRLYINEPGADPDKNLTGARHA